jgi:hypothetical protein
MAIEVRWYLAPLEAVPLPSGRVVRGSRLMRYYRGAPARVSILKTDNQIGAMALTRFAAEPADHQRAMNDPQIVALPDMTGAYDASKFSREVREQLIARGIAPTAPPPDLVRVPTMADAWRRIARGALYRHRNRAVTPTTVDDDTTPIRIGPETL